MQIKSSRKKRLSLENTELEANATLTSLSCADITGHGIVSKKFNLFVLTLYSTDSTRKTKKGLFFPPRNNSLRYAFL